MAVISDSIFQVILPSGNRAAYSVQPHHINDIPGTTLAERARCYGTQIAVQIGGQWYRPGGREPIEDVRTCALLDRVPDA